MSETARVARLSSPSDQDAKCLGKGRVLMHVCCAPCAEYPVMVLRDEGCDMDLLYFNPNIHPSEEWALRLENVRLYAEKKGLRVFVDERCSEERWRNHRSPYKEDHCAMCYFMRMDFAARFAAEHGYDSFTSSLFVSPYQNFEKLRDSARKAAERYGIPFLERDFREGFRRGQEMAKEDGLYCQKYCGCIFSLGETRYAKKLSRRFGLEKEDIPARRSRAAAEGREKVAVVRQETEPSAKE